MLRGVAIALFGMGIFSQFDQATLLWPQYCRRAQAYAGDWPGLWAVGFSAFQAGPDARPCALARWNTERGREQVCLVRPWNGRS